MHSHCAPINFDVKFAVGFPLLWQLLDTKLNETHSFLDPFWASFQKIYLLAVFKGPGFLVYEFCARPTRDSATEEIFPAKFPMFQIQFFCSLCRTPALAHTAALGLADNNTGELVAIGMALDMFKQQGGRGAFHIFSDSKATIHALTRGWNLGASCAPALAATRSLLANILQGPCSVRFHWVPGHSHIELNELADKAAGAGSKASALPRNANININYSCRGFSFSTLGTLFAQGAPPAYAAN